MNGSVAPEDLNHHPFELGVSVSLVAVVLLSSLVACGGDDYADFVRNPSRSKGKTLTFKGVHVDEFHAVPNKYGVYKISKTGENAMILWDRDGKVDAALMDSMKGASGGEFSFTFKCEKGNTESGNYIVSAETTGFVGRNWWGIRFVLIALVVLGVGGFVLHKMYPVQGQGGTVQPVGQYQQPFVQSGGVAPRGANQQQTYGQQGGGLPEALGMCPRCNAAPLQPVPGGTRVSCPSCGYWGEGPQADPTVLPGPGEPSQDQPVTEHPRAQHQLQPSPVQQPSSVLPPQVQPANPSCPHCGGPTEFLVEQKRFGCPSCRRILG
jgi:hypothetical protein